MHARHVIAFGAAALQAALSAHFFVVFVHKIYIEGVLLDRHHVGEILNSSVYIARHSSVVVMSYPFRKPIPLASGYLHIDEYAWTHPSIRPWGQELPLQCPSCGALASLRARSTGGGRIDARCSRDACGNALHFLQPEDWRTIKGGEGGAWSIRPSTL